MTGYKQIAEVAGVSIGTVYRVMHERGRFAAQTAERVRRVARDLGYTKNIYASNLSRSRRYEIGVVMPDPAHDNTYWSQPHAGVADAVAALEHYRITHRDCFYDEHDPRSFRDALDDALSFEPDAVIVAPSVGADSQHILVDAGIPVPLVVLDTFVPVENRLGFVGQDGYASGLAAGRLVRLLARDERPIVAVQTLPASGHIRRRVTGFRDSFGDEERHRLIEIDVDFAGPDALASIAGAASPDAAWFVSNSNASLLADCLDSLYGAQRRPIVGYDLVPANVRALEDERLSFILSQRPHEQGRIAVEMIYRSVVLHEEVAGDRIVPIDIITRETLAGRDAGVTAP